MKISLSISPILYHITTIGRAASIADTNRFELKPSDGTQAEEALSGGAYYLSTARHKLASYTVAGIYKFSVIYVLDGRELGTRYRAKAVDFWSGVYNDHDPTQPSNRHRMESEDRIYSKSPFIKSASRYITEIHCHINEKRNLLLKIKRYALKNKIGIWFYADTKAMLLLNKAKAVSFDLVKMEPEEVRPPSEFAARRYKRDKNRNEITGWLQLYDIPKNGTDWRTKGEYLGEQGKDCLKYLQSYNGDALRQLNAGMHNEKSTAYGEVSRGREDLDRLIQILRANKWTVKDFINILYAKWYPPEEN